MAYEEFFEKLRVQLRKTESWPTVYMFKFIIPDDNRKFALVRKLFSSEAEIYHKYSRNGNYISVTGKEVMTSAEEVIDKYKQAAKIEGIISL
ncbi:MAG: DUF493 domain-containing protein [Bacteroidales bacterium]|nr:DUF493 domain-containing protein [Bacteroidales bacterium]